jgi:hypothetical protein
VKRLGFYFGFLLGEFARFSVAYLKGFFVELSFVEILKRLYPVFFGKIDVVIHSSRFADGICFL